MIEHPFEEATTFWDREISHATHVSWMENATIREYINSSFDQLWPLDWFQGRFPNLRFRRALSIGCGTGGLERDLLRRQLCERIDAFDGSVGSVVVARQLAANEGLTDRVRYFAADFNNFEVRRVEYNAVFFHQSLHHVGKIERLLSLLGRRLADQAVVYLDEYIGPSRTDWNDELISGLRRLYSTIPAAARLQERLALPIQSDDPSEAIRSGEILTQLKIGFAVEELRPYGGNVLSVLYPAIQWEKAPHELLQRLVVLDAESATMTSPFHAVIVARPKRGIRRYVATLRYFLEPKWRRIKWEARQRLGRPRNF